MSSHGVFAKDSKVQSSADLFNNRTPHTNFPFLENSSNREPRDVSIFKDSYMHKQLKLPVAEDKNKRKLNDWSCLSILVIAAVLGGIILLGVIATMFMLSRKGQSNVKAKLECSLNIIVSTDGNSNSTTISEAVDTCWSSNLMKCCIFIQAGQYHETVIISEQKKNLMLIGEGIEKTIITSNASAYMDRDHIGHDATLKIFGNGFLAQDLTIANTNTYRLAVKNLGDNTVFLRCTLEGYNTTLYMRGIQQFYRNCTFRGQSSLISGSAAAFFQKCELFSIILNPQERTVFFSITGRKNKFIFHHCLFHVIQKVPKNSPTTNLGGYFGDLASTVVVLQSFLDESIDGYFLGNPPYATFYVIFDNVRSGSPITNIPSYILLLNSIEKAAMYSLRQFLGYPNWIPVGVEYDLDLTM